MKNLTNLSTIKAFILIISISINLSFINSFPLYDINDSNVVNLNPKNYETQITKNRSKNTVSFVHYYTKDDLKSNQSKQEIDKLASEYDGMFKIAALDCGEFRELCEKHDIREYPSYRIIPPLPAPIFPYEGDLTTKSILSNLGRFVDNKTLEVHSGNIDDFLTQKVNLPKVILFTDKAGVPLIYKVLALQFDQKLNFAVVRKDESSLIQKYKIKTFPKIMVVPVGEKKKNEYFEGETKFKRIYDFLNIYSETFFKVGEDKTTGASSDGGNGVSRPWLNEKLPELNKESASDVCFKVDGIICVILLNNKGEESKVDNNLADLMSEIQNYLSPKMDYGGIKYKFGWINTKKQPEFTSAVGADFSNVKDNYKVMIINPGKRKRYFVVDEEVTFENLRNTFDKLASGDLRFKMFSGNNIPELN